MALLSADGEVILIDAVPIPLAVNPVGKLTLVTEKVLGKSSLIHLILLAFEGIVAVKNVVGDPVQNEPAIVTASASENNA